MLLHIDLYHINFNDYRLGVGAPIPESSNISRDTARLKNQLTGGKKRGRDEDETKHPNLSEDDDGESRAAVMQKKVKVDPFSGGKKKKHQANGFPMLRDALISSHPQTAEPNGLNDESGNKATKINQQEDLVGESSITEVASTTKKKKKHRNNFTEVAESTGLISPSLTLARMSAPEIHETVSTVNILTTNGSPQSPTTNPPGMTAYFADYLHLIDSYTASDKTMLSTPSNIRFPSHITATLKLPLLNLDGPPPHLSDSEDGKDAAQSSSPKKKRKRRKKKKQTLIAAPPDPNL